MDADTYNLFCHVFVLENSFGKGLYNWLNESQKLIASLLLIGLKFSGVIHHWKFL